MTEKRFTLIDMNNIEKELLSPIKDNGSDCLTWFEVEECLNALHEENEQLKKEKESWKSSACNNSSFNSILLHELDIAQEQGYKLSDPFKKLMREKND